jgi:hypothetical protein
MAKKAAKPASKGSGKETGGMSAEQHRRKAAELHAQARLHDARADLAEAKNPPKKPPKYGSRGYPC